MLKLLLKHFVLYYAIITLYDETKTLALLHLNIMHNLTEIQTISISSRLSLLLKHSFITSFYK